MTQARNLDEFIKNNSKFLRLEDKESFEGVFKGYKIIPNQFDPEKEQVVYKLEDKDGRAIFFQTASVAVAKIFKKLGVDGQVNIVRHGEGTKTQYKITSPDLPKKDEIDVGDDLPEHLREPGIEG